MGPHGSFEGAVPQSSDPQREEFLKREGWVRLTDAQKDELRAAQATYLETLRLSNNSSKSLSKDALTQASAAYHALAERLGATGGKNAVERALQGGWVKPAEKSPAENS